MGSWANLVLWDSGGITPNWQHCICTYQLGPTLLAASVQHEIGCILSISKKNWGTKLCHDHYHHSCCAAAAELVQVQVLEQTWCVFSRKITICSPEHCF